ncbi:MAG: ECF transporter S component, partial [Clostridia bacterium]|nr:ECF transporter S component [Clostridia bacterium]
QQPDGQIGQTTEQTEAEACVVKKKKSAGEFFKNYFTATRIAYMAIFTAISYAIGLLDFSLMPASPVSFLKLDFSNVFVLIGGFSLGPTAGVIIAVLKELLHALTVGQTAFIGELANILIVLPYVLIPSLIYKRRKGIKTVLWSVALGCVGQCLISLPVNYFLTFPAFYKAFGGTWAAGQALFVKVWYWALLFNFIKVLCISAVVIALYKPLSRLIKITGEKFAKLKKKT